MYDQIFDLLQSKITTAGVLKNRKNRHLSNGLTDQHELLHDGAH